MPVKRKQKAEPFRYTLLIFDPEFGGIVGRNDGVAIHMTTAEFRALPEDSIDDFLEVDAQDIEDGIEKACGCHVNTTWNLRVYASYVPESKLWRVETGEAVSARKFNRLTRNR